MSLTREFKETIQARIERDPVFREELLKEGVESLLAGEVETGRLACISHHSTVEARDTTARDFVALACRAQRTVQVRLRAPSGSRLVLTVLSPTSPRRVVRNAG